MITILGASGNIGSKLTANLLARGEKVRVIARSVDKLKTFADQGAELFIGDASDVEFLSKSFSGSDAVFVLIPPDQTKPKFREYQNQFGEIIAQAIKNSGVKYVVNLSSHGADLSEGTGPIKGLHDQEERLNKLSDVNVLHLRPTYFMENTFMFTGMIKNMGMMGSAMRGDMKMPMIATKDIAKIAAEEISERKFSGKTIRELYGQRDVSMNEVAKIFGEKIGRNDLTYTTFPYAAAEAGLKQMGLSDELAQSYIEMSKAFNEGLIKTQPRNSKNTTQTSIEEFSNTFASLYNR